MHRYITRIGLAIVVALACSSATIARAQTSNWNVGSGNWNSPGNWDPSGVPGAGDTVDIINFDGVPRTITYNYTGPAVTLGNITIDLYGSLSGGENTLSMSSNSLTSSGIMYVGYNGNGEVDQSGGTVTFTAAGVVGNLYLGYYSGSSGTYNLSGSGVVNAGGFEEIGASNSGTTGIFNQTGGTNTCDGVLVGLLGTGTYNLHAGVIQGSISVLAGGTFNQFGGNATVPDKAGASFAVTDGTYNLSGGNLTVTGAQLQEEIYDGNFVQSGGVNSASNFLLVTDNEPLPANYTLSAGSLSVSSPAGVAAEVLAGVATFTQTGGTNTIGGTGGLFIGYNGYSSLSNTASGTTSTYALSGTGALTVNSGSEYIGYGNGDRGAFNQSGGNHTLAAGIYLYLGYNSGAQGTYTLSAGALSVAGHEFIGDNGTGTFTQTGGTNTIAAGYYLIVASNGLSNGTYNLSGDGALETNLDEVVGDAGSGAFNQTGGTNTINGGYHLDIGYFSGSTGDYTLSGGIANVSGSVIVGGFSGGAGGIGTLNISGTGVLNVGDLEIYNNAGNSVNLSGGALNITDDLTFSVGSATGTFNQSGGTNEITNSLVMSIGTTGVSTYNLSVGLLQVGSSSNTHRVEEQVGLFGTAIFNQTGGTNDIINGDLVLGETSTAHGTYTLSGGIATIDGGVYVGGSTTSAAGSGVLNVSGTGALTIGSTLTIYNTTGTSVNLSGGTINTAALNFNGNPALLNWTGGTLNLTTDVTFDSAADPTSTSAAFGSALTLGTNQTLMVTGNETLGGVGPFALTLNPGSVHTVTTGLFLEDNGTLNLNGGTLNNSAFYQYGGTVNGTLVVPTNGTYVYIAGTFNGQLVNQGFVEFDETGFTAGNGMNNSGTLYPLGNETVTFNGAGLINSSPIQGFSTNIIAASLTNSGKLSLIDCTLQATGASSNSATGVIDMIGGTLACGTGPSNQLVNDGRINLIDVTVNGDIYSPADGVINTAGSTTFNGNVTAAGQTLVGALQNAGAFYQTAGILIGSGNFTNSGTVVIAGSQSWSNGTTFTNTAGSATFQSDAGSAGSSPLTVLVNGGVVTFTVPEHLAALSIASPGGTLGFDLASPTSFGKAIVNGLLTAGGTLQVSLTNNFTPVKGDSFDLLDWGPLSGTFSSVDLPTMNGRIVWDSSQLYTTGAISVVATYYAGDFNRDGHVDAADVLAMEFALVDLSGYQNGGDSLHESLTNAEMLAIGDINGDGVVNNADLQALLALLKSGGGSSNPVPEPASWVLAFLALALVSGIRFYVRCVR